MILTPNKSKQKMQTYKEDLVTVDIDNISGGDMSTMWNEDGIRGIVTSSLSNPTPAFIVDNKMPQLGNRKNVVILGLPDLYPRPVKKTNIIVSSSMKENMRIIPSKPSVPKLAVLGPKQILDVKIQEPLRSLSTVVPKLRPIIANKVDVSKNISVKKNKTALLTHQLKKALSADSNSSNDFSLTSRELSKSNENIYRIPKLPLRPLPRKELEYYKCTYCSIVFKTRHSLMRHTQSMHLGICYVCPYCAKGFDRRLCLKKHLIEIHTVCDPELTHVMNLCIKCVQNELKEWMISSKIKDSPEFSNNPSQAKSHKNSYQMEQREETDQDILIKKKFSIDKEVKIIVSRVSLAEKFKELNETYEDNPLHTEFEIKDEPIDFDDFDVFQD